MALREKIETLKAEVLDFTQQIVRILSRKPPTVEVSDNSTLLNNRTPAQMTADADALTSAHALRTDNPHKLNPTILKAYTDGQLTTLVDPLILQSEIPVSQFGDLSSAALPVTFSGWQLRFTAQIPLVLWGRGFTLPMINKLITDDVPSPAGKTLYVYAVVTGNTATYKLYEAFQIDGFNQLYIGTVTCGASAISAVNVGKVTKLDNFRLSATPIGGGIPYSTGLPTAAGAIPTAWKP